MEKYISFSPHDAGFINVLMNLEVALSLSEITGRTLIIPPNFWCFSVSEGYGKENFIDILKYFNKERIYSNFNCVDFYDVPDLKELFSKIEKKETETKPYSYTGNIHNHNIDLKNIIFLNEFQEPCVLSDSQVVMYCGDILDKSDFLNFSGRRKSLNLDLNQKFLHFEWNLYGLYWYSVYPGNGIKRNNLKKKINSSLLYREKFADISNKVYNTIGPYDSIHVRRNDFLTDRIENISDVSTPSKFSAIVKYLLKDDRPVYIATDEKDLSFFDELKKYKKLYFFKDFYEPDDKLGDSIIEQLICVNSNVFYGTYKSTYSKRINILRGYQNKQSSEGIGINNLYKQICDYNNPLPWTNQKVYWYWSSPSHPQWMYE
jgi:hypothetical protein